MAKSSKGDAGERIAARKQTFHNCSAAFCIMLAVLGVCLALQRDQQEGSAQTIYLLAGVFQTVMSLIALFMGVLLPEEGGRMPGWARRIVRAVAFVSMLGGRGDQRRRRIRRVQRRRGLPAVLGAGVVRGLAAV